jgi:hypothetical protein
MGMREIKPVIRKKTKAELARIARSSGKSAQPIDRLVPNASGAIYEEPHEPLGHLWVLPKIGKVFAAERGIVNVSPEDVEAHNKQIDEATRYWIMNGKPGESRRFAIDGELIVSTLAGTRIGQARVKPGTRLQLYLTVEGREFFGIIRKREPKPYENTVILARIYGTS